MAIHGFLSTMPLDDVLGWIGMSKRDGVLTANRLHETRKLYFSKGNVVAAFSTRFSERLGGILTRSGAIESESVKKDLNLNMDNGRAFAQVLLNKGVLDLSALLRAVNAQLEEVIFSLFSWPEGLFSFREQELPYRDLWPLKLGLTNLLMEGARRADEMKKYSTDYQAFWEVPLEKVPEAEKKFAKFLSSAESSVQWVGPRMDGTNTIEQLLVLSLFSEYDTLTALNKILSGGYARAIPAGEKPAIPEEEEVKKLLTEAEGLYSYGRLEEALGVWSRTAARFPNRPDIRKRHEDGRIIVMKSLQAKLGPNSRILKRQEILKGLDPERLFLTPGEKDFLAQVDNVKTMKAISQKLGMTEPDLYLYSDRLLTMDYVA